MKWYSHAEDAFNVQLFQLTDKNLTDLIIRGYSVIDQAGLVGKVTPVFMTLKPNELDMPLWLHYERPAHLKYLWD